MSSDSWHIALEVGALLALLSVGAVVISIWRSTRVDVPEERPDSHAACSPISTTPLSVALCVSALGFALWVGGALLQQTSPTERDPSHSIRTFNGRNTRYITPVTMVLPWLGLPLVAGSALYNFAWLARVSARTGIPPGALIRKIRLFSTIDVGEDGDRS